jgi:hypothetical protein
MDQSVNIKSLMILSDEIIEDDEESESKKIEILLDKMLVDKSLINDKTFSSNFNEYLISQIYIALSPEAKKLVTEKKAGKRSDIDTSYFYNLIGFNYDKFLENPVITNDILMNINNNIIKIEDCKFFLTI